MAQIGNQAVGHVGHRGRACIGGNAALPVMHVGRQMQPAELVVPANGVAQQCVSRSRAAEAADHGHRVTGVRTVKANRVAAAEITQHRDRDHPLRGRDEIAADYPSAESAGFFPHAVGEREDVVARCVAGCAESDDEGGRRRTHRLDVGRVLGYGLAAESVVSTSPTGSGGPRRACRSTPRSVRRAPAPPPRRRQGRAPPPRAARDRAPADRSPRTRRSPPGVFVRRRRRHAAIPSPSCPALSGRSFVP